MSIAPTKLNKPEVIQVYSRMARIHDIWGILTESKARKRALALARIRDGESILEVAVGTGLTFHEILKANPHGHNTGIDLTPAILEKARRRSARKRSAPGARRVPVRSMRRSAASRSIVLPRLRPYAVVLIVTKEHERGHRYIKRYDALVVIAGDE